MWASLKRRYQHKLEQNFPTKMSSTCHTHPWVSTSLKRMMRRKQRAHRKAKMSGQSKGEERFKRLQSEVQRSTCTAQIGYMADVVSSELKDNTKRFWPFIKSKRQEPTGVALLINKEGYLLHKESGTPQLAIRVRLHEKKNTYNIPDKGPPIDNIIIDPNGVKKLYLMTFDRSNLQALTGYQPFIIRAAALSPILILIYQRSLGDGCVPVDWREALTVPLYKMARNTYYPTTNLSP